MNDQQLRAWLADTASAPASTVLRSRVAAITTAPTVARRAGLWSWRLPLAFGLVAAALAGAVLVAGTVVERPPDLPSNGILLPGNGILLLATTEDPIAVDPATGRRLSPFEPLLVGSVARGTDLRGATDYAWSPDGWSVASSRGAAIQVLDLRTGEGRTFDVDGCPEYYGCGVAWSPDGSTLAVTTHADDLRGGHLLLVDLATGSTTTIATMPGAPSSPSWSPDGRMLAFADRPGVWTVRRDGSDLTRVATEEGTSPDEGAARIGPIDVQWSPDGTRIGYLTSEDREQSGPWLLRVVSIAPDGSDRRVIADAGACHCLGWGPPSFTWSPDGMQIAFVTLGYIPPHRARDYASPKNGGLYVANVDGSSRELLVRDAFGSPTWQPVP